jgi:Cu2+-exporting ATPase
LSAYANKTAQSLLPLMPSSPWTILDQQDQWQSFSEMVGSDSQQLVQSSLLLEGLRCAACTHTIEQGLTALPGVISARVSMSKSRATVVWSSAQTRPSAILDAIKALGYSALPASQRESELQATKKQRAAFWRWMVAGFCMMQVMMYASPSYFIKPGEMTEEVRQLLNWASWLLSMPVMIFSSRSFFSQAWHDLKNRQVSMDLPVTLGIVITFIVSSAATFEPNGWWGNTVYFDTLTMFVFFLLSARLVEAKLHTRTLGALENLVNRIPESIERRNADNTYSRILNRQLQVNDIVRVHLGEAFPADGVLTDGHTQVDESLLTGEATPIQKNTQDAVIAGSYNLASTVHMRIEKLGDTTQYGQIVNLIHQAAMEKPRLAQIADTVARPFLLFVIASAALAAALLWDVDHGRALMTAAAVLIVTCPCALSLATPAAMLASASSFVKRGILIRHLQAIESLAAIDTVIFDKTGTLTDDRMQVTATHSRNGYTEAQVLALAASLAQHSLHPVSRAINLAQAHSDTPTVLVTNIQEEVGAGIQAIHNQQFIKLGSAKFCGLAITASAQQVYLTDAQGWLATFELSESVKPRASQTVQQLKEAQLSIELLSGDQQHGVSQLANVVGIHHYQAACSPQDKLTRLQALKQQGKKVLMVGDGLNDGPILASAHVSIAMGKGVPLSLAHADYVLLNGDIGQIPALIAQAKKTMRIVKQNIGWAIAYNLVCIPLAFTGVLSAWLAGLGMALSSLLVIANAMRLSRAPASTLTQEEAR